MPVTMPTPLPTIVITNDMPWLNQWRFFKELTKSYDGLSGPSSAQDKLFDCPADTFSYGEGMGGSGAYDNTSEFMAPDSDFSSYWFNRCNLRTNALTGEPYHGISGLKLSSIRNSVRTALVADQPLCFATLFLASTAAGISGTQRSQRCDEHGQFRVGTAMSVIQDLLGRIQWQRTSTVGIRTAGQL